MKNSIHILSIFLLSFSALFSTPKDGKYRYTLKNVFEVKGRQGIAVDNNNYYVSGSKALYKYSKKGELLLENKSPFENLPVPANHIGDIDVYKGELYTGCETFIDGRGQDIQIVIYNAGTLEYVRTIDWEPSSGQVEVSGITVDAKRKLIWMSDWVNGSYIYKYDLLSGEYLGKLHLQTVPEYQQGLFSYKDWIFITADDGDAELDEPDHMYKVNISDMNQTAGQISLEKTFTDIKRSGEIEGLCVDSEGRELLVLFNRGKRIVLGMPKGFYPGYDREIHEVYIYKMSR